jgi:hypothetical protein
LRSYRFTNGRRHDDQPNKYSHLRGSDSEAMTAATAYLHAAPARRVRAARRHARPQVGPSELTALFDAILRRADNERISVRELLGGLETSAFGIPLAALAVPEVIPIPVPGLALVISLPMAMLGAQMATARGRIWLPRALLDRRIPAKPLKRAARAMLPGLRALERSTRPRATWMVSKAGQRVIGLAVIVLALLIALPVPGTNLPLALTVFVLAVGLIRRDGLLIAAGLLLTAVSLALMASASLLLVELIVGAFAA